tara:strand:+ start:1389 stop:1676 length:288 start_codon:yes stop_codon:yes gene_type:complete
VLDFDHIRDKLTTMLNYHNSNISSLDSINNNELESSILYLKSSINREIINPIRRAIAMIEIINDIGIDNIPHEMKIEWLEDIEMISSLKSLEVKL